MLKIMGKEIITIMRRNFMFINLCINRIMVYFRVSVMNQMKMTWCLVIMMLLLCMRYKTFRAATCDFQQCGILTSVGSDEPVQPPFELRNSKYCSVSSLKLHSL